MKKFMVAMMCCLGLVGVTAPAAMADNTLVQVNKTATRSATHVRLFVNVTVACSPDTFNAVLSLQASQVNSAGGVQTATGTVASLGAFECSGEEEVVQVPVRKPIGGFNWHAGTAAIRNVAFVTQDPSGVFASFLKGRTVIVK
jgi:hypothetical protein